LNYIVSRERKLSRGYSLIFIQTRLLCQNQLKKKIKFQQYSIYKILTQSVSFKQFIILNVIEIKLESNRKRGIIIIIIVAST